MKKSLKKQIKQDEFATGYARARAWIDSHVEETRATVIGVLILAGVLGGLYYFRQDRQRSAGSAFGEALAVYEAKVKTDASASTAAQGEPVFATKEEKFKRAMVAFDGVAERYGSLSSGRRARYYAALCRVELGRFDDAAKMLEAVAKVQGVDGSLARLELAELDRKRGTLDRSIAAYRRLLDEPEPALPRDHLLMRLASALEDAGRTDEAAEAYRLLTRELPLSVYSNEAQTRADFLSIKERS